VPCHARSATPRHHDRRCARSGRRRRRIFRGDTSLRTRRITLRSRPRTTPPKPLSSGVLVRSSPTFPLLPRRRWLLDACPPSAGRSFSLIRSMARANSSPAVPNHRQHCSRAGARAGAGRRLRPGTAISLAVMWPPRRLFTLRGRPGALIRRKSADQGAPCTLCRSDVVASRSHPNPKMGAYLTGYKVADTVSIGSSLKFCLVARGTPICIRASALRWSGILRRACRVARRGRRRHSCGWQPAFVRQTRIFQSMVRCRRKRRPLPLTP